MNEGKCLLVVKKIVALYQFRQLQSTQTISRFYMYQNKGIRPLYSVLRPDSQKVLHVKNCETATDLLFCSLLMQLKLPEGSVYCCYSGT